MKEKIEIPLSRMKITLHLVGSVFFVVLGIMFTIKPEAFISMIFRNLEIIRFAGVLSVVFFGLCLVFIAKKLFSHKAGLIIDQYGITENTNATSVGLIEWEDITGIERIEIFSKKN